MAVNCDLCGKGAKARNGAGLYAIKYAFRRPGVGISITLSIISEAVGTDYDTPMVCGNCLEKMRVFELADKQEKQAAEYKRRQELAEQAGNVIDVTPSEVRQIGPRRMRLLGSGE